MSFFFFYSRPIRLAFEPESVENVQNEYKRVMDQIAALLPMILEEGVSVRFKGWATMLDGKALGYINRVLAMQNCPLCNSTPTKMSTRASLFDELIDDPDALKHGFSPLHYKMRAMEFLLHLGMHSRIKLAACPGSGVEGVKSPEQIDRDERLKQIQDALEDHLGIKVCRRDKMGGSTNSGPCAKRFWTGNPEIMAKILDVPAELFITLRDMGNAISSSFEINPDEFQKIADRFHACFFDNFQKPQTPAARDESEDRRGAPSRGRSRSPAGGSRGRAGRAPRANPQEEEAVENRAPQANPQEQEDVDDPELQFRRVRQPARSTAPRGRSTGPRGRSTRGTDQATRRPARSTTAPPNYRDETSEESDGTNTERLLREMHINVGRGRGTKRAGAKRPRKKKQPAKAETWYMMSSTVHKVYKHGAAIIKACNFPPGLLSEEPSEANNKKIRYFREKLSRKFTRKQTMTDLFYRLMYCSDPLILQDIAPKRLRERKKLPIHPSIVPLLKTPEVDGQKFEESAVSRFCLYLHEKEVLDGMDYEEDDHIIVGGGNYTYEDDDAEENPGNVFWTRAEPETPVQVPQDQGDTAQPTASLSQRVNESESDPMDDDNWDGSPIENIVFHPPKAAHNTMSRETAATTRKPSSDATDSSDTQNNGKRKKRQQRPRKVSKCDESSSSE